MGNGKQLVCDIQGADEDGGDFVLLDPCILRTNLPGVSDLVGTVAPNTKTEASGLVADRFDALHPTCAQMCKTFDPQRKSAKRNVGLCGAICGLGGGQS